VNMGEIAAYCIAALLLLLLFRIFYKPLKGVFVLLFQSVIGGAGLYIFNLIIAQTGFVIGVNIVTASICGLLGLPGFILLFLGKLLFTYV